MIVLPFSRKKHTDEELPLHPWLLELPKYQQQGAAPIPTRQPDGIERYKRWRGRCPLKAELVFDLGPEDGDHALRRKEHMPYLDGTET